MLSNKHAGRPRDRPSWLFFEKHHWPQNTIKIYPFITIITASLNGYHTTLELIVHLMLDVGAHTLPCLLCWLPHLLSHHVGRSRTMGFCCSSLKGLMRVVLLSTVGEKPRKIRTVVKIIKEPFTSLFWIFFCCGFTEAKAFSNILQWLFYLSGRVPTVSNLKLQLSVRHKKNAP